METTQTNEASWLHALTNDIRFKPQTAPQQRRGLHNYSLINQKKPVPSVITITSQLIFQRIMGKGEREGGSGGRIRADAYHVEFMLSRYTLTLT